MSTKEEIMDYVLHTPENVNPAILSDKLDQYSSGGGGGGMLITVSQSGADFILDKNYTEIKNALESGIFPFALVPGDSGLYETYVIVDYGYSREKYTVELFSFRGGIQGTITFLSDTDDGVLTMYQG